MANQANKTEHTGAKKGNGAYWGRKKHAKHESNKQRRVDSKELSMADLDSYSYHEALDRTHILLCNLEEALGNHPVIRHETEARELYDAAIENLAELYQYLGGISIENK